MPARSASPTASAVSSRRRTPTVRRMGLALASLVAVASLAGCGGKPVEQSSIENTARQILTEREEFKVDSVSCPNKLESKAGATTACTAQMYGEAVPVTMTVVDVVEGSPQLDAALDPTLTPTLLAARVRAYYAVEGEPEPQVTCEGPLPKAIGAKQRCAVTEGDQKFTATATIEKGTKEDQTENQQVLNITDDRPEPAVDEAATAEDGASAPAEEPAAGDTKDEAPAKDQGEASPSAKPSPKPSTT